MREYQTKANQNALPDSITPEKLGAGEANSFLAELAAAVSSSGQTLAPASGVGEVLDQLAKAMAVYGAGGGEYCLDTGAAGAYVLTPVSPRKGAPALTDGLTLSFKPGSPNPGAATVNYNGIGSVDIRRFNGDALAGGELSTSSRIRYNESAGYFELVGYLRSSVQVFTSSGTYTRPANLVSCIVIAVGGGGGGGGAENGTASETAGGGGGGGGGTSLGFFTYADISASETVTIGAAGVGANGVAGTTGGTTSFGSLVTAQGGRGGEVGSANASMNFENGGRGGPLGTGTIAFAGGCGGFGMSSGAVSGGGGKGGDSFLAGGAETSRSATTQHGIDADPGGGGGGGGATGTSSISQAAGGMGGIGRLIVIEFRGEQ